MDRNSPLWHSGSALAPSGHVVVGVDGSDGSLSALDRAVGEAQRRRVLLEIVHAWPWAKPGAPGSGSTAESELPYLEAARNVLNLAVARVAERAPALTAVPTLTADPAASTLLRCGGRAALTVVGTRGRGGFAGLLLGSVSLRVAAHTRVPLMVVRGELPPVYGEKGHGKVLVGVESGRDLEAARFAFEEASRRHAHLRVLHAWTYPPLSSGVHPVPAAQLQEDLDRRARAEAAVPRQVVAELREKFPDVPIRTASVKRGAARALVEATRAADVVVVAAHRRRGHLGMQLGPVTHALLHHAHCPVVLVPVE